MSQSVDGECLCFHNFHNMLVRVNVSQADVTSPNITKLDPRTNIRMIKHDSGVRSSYYSASAHPRITTNQNLQELEFVLTISRHRRVPF